MGNKKKKQNEAAKGQMKISNFFGKAGPSTNLGIAAKAVPERQRPTPSTSTKPIAVIELISDDEASNKLSGSDSDCISPTPTKLPPSRKRKRRGAKGHSPGRKGAVKRNERTPVKRQKIPDKIIISPEQLKDRITEFLGNPIVSPFIIQSPEKTVTPKNLQIVSPDKKSVFRELHENNSPLDKVSATTRSKRLVAQALFSSDDALDKLENHLETKSTQSAPHKIFDDICALKPAVTCVSPAKLKCGGNTPSSERVIEINKVRRGTKLVKGIAEISPREAVAKHLDDRSPKAVTNSPKAVTRSQNDDTKSPKKSPKDFTTSSSTRSLRDKSKSPIKVPESPKSAAKSPKCFSKSPKALSRSMIDFVTPTKAPQTVDKSPKPAAKSPKASASSLKPVTTSHSVVSRATTDRPGKLRNTSRSKPDMNHLSNQATLNDASPRSDSLQAGKGSSQESGIGLSSNSMDPNDEWLEGLCLEDWDIDGVKAMEETDTGLELQRLQRCTVLKVTIVAGGRDKVLWLQSTVDGTKTTCRLQEMWSEYAVAVGDVVSVQAVRRAGDREWRVDSTDGLLVLSPDMLISGTTVVGSLFCERRSALAGRFAGVDPANKDMVVGVIVHDLMQKVLKDNLTTRVSIVALAKRLMSLPRTISSLYSSGLSLDDTLAEVLTFATPIANFVSRYYRRDGRRLHEAKPQDWAGEICEIQDIEENVWVPALGLKGKMDLTAQVRIHGKQSVVPIEIKTGRASRSAEHKGQVMLYNMMMNETSRETDRGLLLYIRGGSLDEVKVNRRETAGLVHLRNRLVGFLANRVQPPDDETGFAPLMLPEPINHHNACGKCPYLQLCLTFLQHDGLDKVSPNNPLLALVAPATQHLSQRHVDYFMHWSNLLLLEDTAERPANQQLSDMWTRTPAERESRGGCISNLKVVGKSEDDSGRCLYALRRISHTSDLRRTTKVAADDYVALNTDARFALYTGTVVTINKDGVSVATDRPIRHDVDTVFHVDVINNYVPSSLNMTFLSLLMEDTENAARLRRCVVDRSPPTFSKLPSTIVPACTDIFPKLNVGQQTAVLKVLSANDYVLIKGMPGTGKTATIAALVAVLVRIGQSVLIVSHTHSAVDNVLLKVKANSPSIDILRLGKISRVHPELRDNGEAKVLARCTTPEALEKAINAKPVVATTCLGANHALLSCRRFSVCIVDESTQVLQPSVLRSLFAAEKFVLVGDPEQLPPVVQHRQARTLGMCESLFVRLDTAGATVSLDAQYRMNRTLTELANALTYGGLLMCATEKVAEATLNTTQRDDRPEWLEVPLSSRMEHSAVFLDTGCVGEMPAVSEYLELIGQEDRTDDKLRSDPGCRNDVKSLKDQRNIKEDKSTSDQGNRNDEKSTRDQGNWNDEKSTRDQGNRNDEKLKRDQGNRNDEKSTRDQGNRNVYEAGVVLRLIQEFQDSGVSPEDVGVMAPYRSQVVLLQRLLAHTGVEVNTVDQFQGRDKEVVVYSCTRSDARKERTNARTDETNARRATEVLGDKRRLTVAVTRAKRKLVVVGDAGTLRGYDPFSGLLDSVRQVEVLVEGERGFEWAELVGEVQRAFSAACDVTLGE